jgi:NADP-dependent 3-hydroxy acid dehydrogenase YdfG
VSQLDVTSLEEMQTFTAFAAEKLGPIDVLVNNAGIMLSPLHELMIDVNIRGVLHGIAAGLPKMRARKFGQIVLPSRKGCAWKITTCA